MTETPNRHEGRGWPAWLEPLRPDPLARLRMRREIGRRAASLLAAARPSWTDVASDWARPLVPLAATLMMVFGALAWAAATDAPTDPGGIAGAEAPGMPWEPVAAEVTDAPPVLLIGSYEPSADGVLSAALQHPRPGSPGAGEGR